MTTRDDFDRRLHSWLAGHEWEREPELLLEEVLARTARTRRRPAWQIPERWISMSAITSRLAPTAPVPWRAVGLAALLVLALVASIVLIAGSRPFRPAPPFGLADNGALAYSIDGEILVLDALGGTPRTVLAGPETDTSPQFAPDGSHLLILREGDEGDSLVWAGHDGSNPRVILEEADGLSWAEIGPRGDIVALQLDTEPGVIRILDTDGSGSRTIDTGLPALRSPIFRPPTGDQLSFEGWDAAGDPGIFLINLDGSGLVRLELDPGFQDDPTYAEDKDFYFLNPAWSPDGTRLTYHNPEPAPASPAGAGFRIHLASITADGQVSSEELLEYEPTMDDEFAAAWLPSGDRILYHSLDGSSQGVWVVDPDGGAPRNLGLSATGYIGTMVSPDGTQVIAFIPVPGTEKPDVRVIDLVNGDTDLLELGGDAVWQRAAPSD